MYPKKTRFKRIKTVTEMLGRPFEKIGMFSQIKAKFNGYQTVVTIDSSRTSVGLARSCFYANEYKDKKTGEVFGAEYLLGASFAKPIVNISAAFAMGTAPQIVENKTVTEEDDEETDADKKTTPKLDAGGNPITPNPVDDNSNPVDDPEADPLLQDEPINKTVANVNQWLDEHRHDLFLYARNTERDGDVFVVMEDDGEMLEVPSEDVDVIVDEWNPNKIAGYDIFTSIKDPADKTKSKTINYVDEIRTTYRRRCIIDDNQNRIEQAGTKVDYRNEADGGLEERQLPVVHFANEREGRMLYGVSEYQSLYYLFANYHAVLAAAIKGNIFNSTSVPTVSGLKNVKQFLELNAQQETDENGKIQYNLKWDANKMLVAGEGGKIDMLQATGTAGDAQIILNILFWLISQNSETPEFAFGTAVQSSKASVSEQTPMLIKKAIRKQGQMEAPVRQLIDLYIERMAKLRPDEFDQETQYNIDMPDILDEDLNVNQQIVSTLLDDGLITEKTALIMLNLGKYVKDLDKELAKAKAQKKARTPSNPDIFGGQTVDPETEAQDIQKVKAGLAAMKKNPSTAKVAEMLAPFADRLPLNVIAEMADQPEKDPKIQAYLDKHGVDAFAKKYNGKLSRGEIDLYVEIVNG